MGLMFFEFLIKSKINQNEAASLPLEAAPPSLEMKV
jgi:hypothetical protein